MRRVGRAIIPGVALVLGAACGGPGAPHAPRVPGAPPSGAGLADYDWPLRTLHGERLSFERYRGRVVFLNLWATWCPPCVEELGSIERLRRSLADDRVAFVLVSPEAPGPVEDFLRRNALDVPVVLEDGRAPASWGVEALPTTWIVAPDGRVVLKHRGAADWNDPAIRTLLRELAEGA